MRTVSALLPFLAVGFSIPAEVTEKHLEALTKCKEIAQSTADMAKAELIKQLGSFEFRELIALEAPELLRYSAEELHQQIHDEYQVTEICHNWEPMPWGNIDGDLSLNSSIGQPYLYNQWQLASLGFTQKYPNVYSNRAEVMLYHMQNFSSPTGIPTFQEASERLIYGATNLFKQSTGNGLFGGLTMVLNNTHIRNFTAIHATDSGAYEAFCNNTNPPPFYKPNCTAVGPIGTFDHWESNLMSLAGFWDGGVPGSKKNITEIDVLSFVVSAMLQTDYDKQINLTESILYNEACPMMNLRYPEGVKMIVLNVTDNLFGSYIGTQLQQWAISNNWVLSWGYADLTMTGPAVKANKRFLDPLVLQHISAGKNITTDPDFPDLLSVFTEAWATSNKSLPHHINDRQWQADQFLSLWSNISSSILRIQPLFRYACEDPSCAAVRVKDQKCVCS
eukprot:TRINITY_DN8373_c0_g1_i1.p1 TRINITY_DN8373_c0_g1~~TRINITY_DN8373_c0_g1_i1.p1  ORF type:complete len:478 (+),score=64.88 TRINITY_DN8373_c0_g1_i1:92-1435(+)